MTEQAAPLTTYKGFDKNFQCRGFQYEVGKTYETDRANACETGFHACEYPLDVFGYYAPDNSRFAVVSQGGELSRHDEDSKVASTQIAISAEIDIAGLVKAAVNYTMSRVYAPDPQSPATNTGDRSAATNTGDRSAATNTGYSSAATNTGYRSAASVEGKYSVAIATGGNSKAKASAGSAIVLVYRNDDGKLLHIRAAIAGAGEIKPDTWYSLNDLGEFVEMSQ